MIVLMPVVFVLACLGFFDPGAPEPQIAAAPVAELEAPAPPASPSQGKGKQVQGAIQVGDQAVLALDGARTVWLAVKDSAWNPMLDAENARDLGAMAILMAKDEVVRVPCGTKVTVLERSFASTRVRIGEGEHAGVEAWIQREFLARP